MLLCSSLRTKADASGISERCVGKTSQSSARSYVELFETPMMTYSSLMESPLALRIKSPGLNLSEFGFSALFQF